MKTRRGKLLGRYKIVAELGRGAMGTVYKARDPKIDRFVAIKTISLQHTGLQERREFRDRFFVEAQAAGRLLHPGIVTVFDVGEEPETSDPYIVMEYIEGQTLRDLLAGETRKLPLDGALQITQELAEALDYAHAQGVVHRDIKPANILVTKEGQAKIGDFGIAQLDLAHMTLPGRVIGTPAYMSPEQLEGQQVDGRSDLFSLGAILYSLVTGFSPFQGNSATTVCFKVANRDPLRASVLSSDLPPELDSVIARALAKDPAERYQRGMDFARDLRELRERSQLASNPHKGTLSSSPFEARLSRLDAGTKNESSLASPVTMDSSTTPPLTAGNASRIFLSMFLSSRILAGATVTLFLAAMVLSVFAWRQGRVSGRQRTSVVKSTDGVTTPREIQASHPVPQATQDVPQDSHPVPKTSRRVPQSNRRVPPTSDLVTQASQAVPQGSRPPAAIADSNVQIHIENHFSEAVLSVWVDQELAYEQPLRDGHKRHLVLFGRGAKETVTIPLSSGTHGLRVRVRSAAEQYEQSRTISGEFLEGGSKILSINFEKHNKEMRLTLQ